MHAIRSRALGCFWTPNWNFSYANNNGEQPLFRHWWAICGRPATLSSRHDIYEREAHFACQATPSVDGVFVYENRNMPFRFQDMIIAKPKLKMTAGDHVFVILQLMTHALERFTPTVSRRLRKVSSRSTIALCDGLDCSQLTSRMLCILITVLLHRSLIKPFFSYQAMMPMVVLGTEFHANLSPAGGHTETQCTPLQ